MTAGDAERYQAAYVKAVEFQQWAKVIEMLPLPWVSVKLSALHPRYEEKTKAQCLPFLKQRIIDLAVLAKNSNIGLTIDAEEVARLDLSLELFVELASAPELKGWNGLGLAVQAYGRRAKPVLEWLAGLCQGDGTSFPCCTFCKGACWDTEIKRAQEAGLASFSVFTRKVFTDVSYLACTHLCCRDVMHFSTNLATHNAQTVAAISVMTSNDSALNSRASTAWANPYTNQVVKGELINQPCPHLCARRKP